MNNLLAKPWKIFFLLLPRHPYILRQCRRYCNDYLGENEGDMRYNGELFFVKTQLEDCRVVFDVGANEGKWTEEVLRMKSNLEVHCFEPSPSIFARLQQRLRFPNVHLVQKGLSADEEERAFFPEEISVYQGFGVGHTTTTRTGVVTETVSLTTLSNYIKENNVQRVDLMKLDVEGHELQVLRGGLTDFKTGRIKRLYFEYHGTFIKSGIFLRDIFMLFEGLDYRFYKLMPDHLQRVEAYDYRLENFQFKHFAVIHSSVPEKGEVRPLEL